MRGCDFEGCKTPHKAKGLCAGHWSQLRAGKELTPIRPTLRPGDEPWTKETMLKVSDRHGDCIVFGRYQKQKYAFVWIEQKDGKKRQILAHRHMYMLHTGEDIEGMTVHHKCANPRCINPEHLQLASKAENTLEMLGRRDYENQIVALEAKVSSLEERVAYLEALLDNEQVA